MIKSILVTGKSGQLGRSLKKIAGEYPQYDFTFVGRDELDLASPESIAGFFKDMHFDAIINCAAYTAVDMAESEPELADQINHLAVKQLADIAKAQNSFLIHISTDYVFDGTNYKPYVETDKTNPINTYGLTKLKGEQAMQAACCAGAIIRTSWVYSEFGNNFVKTMLRLAQERYSLNVICDQIGSPTYATDLAYAILAILNSKHSNMNESVNGEVKRSNLNNFHYSNEGVCSWYDFAKAIFEIAGVQCEVRAIEAKNYSTAAKRPHYSVLNKLKLKLHYNASVPYWRDGLSRMINQEGALVLE